MSYELALLLIWLHFIGDFILQNDKINMYKELNPRIVAIHTLLYSLCFLWFGWKFWIFVIITHGLVDYILPYIMEKYWRAGAKAHFMKWFAFDQILHISTLIIGHWFFVNA